MRTSSLRVAVVVYLGCALVAGACSSGGPGLLDGGLLDGDGGLDGLLNPDGGGIDATVGGSQDGSSSDAHATPDGSDAGSGTDGSASDAGDAGDGSVAAVCNDAGAYPDAAASAATFTMDSAYGSSGVVAINFGAAGSTYGAGMVRQPDGKLLVGIKVGWNAYTVGVARFLATGALDTTFGTNGVSFVPLGMDASLAGVLLQSSGKIVLAGASDFFGNASTKAWLVRLDANGAVDTSFGANGQVILDASVGAAALQKDDAILVTARRPGLTPPTVGRFTPSGALDATFGSGGWAANTGLTSVGNLVFQQADGKIMIGVSSPRAMARLTAGGALDTTFGSAGTIVDVRNDAGAANALYGFAQQADGKVLAAGRDLEAFGVQRMSADGSGDPTFGASGWGTVPSDAGPVQGAATAAGVQADGKIVAAGALNPFDYGVVRFNTDGGVDTSYGAAGFAKAPFNAFGGISSMVAIADAGTVALAGDQLDYPTNIWVAAVSMLASNGAVATSFGDGGLSTLAAGAWHDEALGLTIQPSDGRALVVGTVAPDRAYVAGGVARLGTTGALDPSFAGTGKTTIVGAEAPTSVVVESTGRIVVGSPSYFGSSSNQNGFMMKALLTDGGADPAFGGDGGVVSVPGFNGRTIALGASDRLAAVGEAPPPFSSGGVGFLVSAFTADGHPSAGWGDAGAGNAPAVIIKTPASAFGGATTAGASAAAVQSDGKIVAVGYAGQSIALARYTTTGALDTTFGTGGVVTTDVGAGGWVVGSFRIAIQSDGALVVAGIGVRYASGSQTNELVVARYDGTGHLDCTFAAGGVATAALGSTEGTSYSQPLPVGLALAPNGRIYVVTTTSADGVKEDVLLLRFTTAGFVDARSVVRLGPGLDLGHGIAVQSDGKVLVAGRTWTQSGLEDFFVARFVPPP